MNIVCGVRFFLEETVVRHGLTALTRTTTRSHLEVYSLVNDTILLNVFSRSISVFKGYRQTSHPREGAQQQNNTREQDHPKFVRTQPEDVTKRGGIPAFFLSSPPPLPARPPILQSDVDVTPLSAAVQEPVTSTSRCETCICKEHAAHTRGNAISST